MKKTTRIAALLAAAALIFGGLFFSCSDSDDGDSGNNNVDITGVWDGTMGTTPLCVYADATTVYTAAKSGDNSYSYLKESVFGTYKVSGSTVTITVGSQSQAFSGEVKDNTISIDAGENAQITLKKVNGATATEIGTKIEAVATNVTFDLSKTGPYKDALLAIFNGGDGATAVKPTSDTSLTANDNVTELVIGNDGASNISFKYNQDSGFTIKTGNATNANAMTIKNVKGNVTVTVTWSIAGKKPAGDRTLTLKAGSQTDTKGNADTASADTPTSIDNTNEITYDFRREGTTNITIDASNEIIVKTIVIAPKN